MHTGNDVKNSYFKENITQKPAGRYIGEVTNKRTGKISYICAIQRKGKQYIKTYPSLKQAEIFRDTILRVLNEQKDKL